MKLALVGPGLKEIPPKGWGAVESLIWDYYINLKKLNYEVDIINNKSLKYMIKTIKRKKYDIIHIMYDDYISLVPHIRRGKILYTSHFAYLTSPSLKTNYTGYYNNIFKKVISYQDKIFINAISEEIKNIYIKEGIKEERIKVICNGAREDIFRFNEECKFPEKSIYIGKIEERKCQYKYQSIKGLEFAGNFHNSSFDRNNTNYLGEWTKEILYDKTTEYANLVLLSDGEADPLVVKEGLMAGLGIVVSECASANLDINKDFIDIVPNDKLNDIDYVQDVIIKNRETSVNMRKEIRKYALDNFSWKRIIEKYLESILILK